MSISGILLMRLAWPMRVDSVELPSYTCGKRDQFLSTGHRCFIPCEDDLPAYYRTKTAGRAWRLVSAFDETLIEVPVGP